MDGYSIWVWELCGLVEVAEMQRKRVNKEERQGYFSFSSILEGRKNGNGIRVLGRWQGII